MALEEFVDGNNDYGSIGCNFGPKQPSPHEFHELARTAGWHPKAVWADRDGLFSVHYLSLSSAEPGFLQQQES